MDKMYISPVARSIPFDNTDTVFVSENVRDAIIESYNQLEARLNFSFTFALNGIIRDSFLNSFFYISSEDVPLITPIDVELLYISLGNIRDIGSANVYVYTINADLTGQTLLQTFVVDGYTYKSTLQTGKFINAGQGLQVRVESTGFPRPRSPVVLLFLRAV